jgi:hypothetical protein
MKATLHFLFQQKMLIFRQDNQNNNLRYRLKPMIIEFQVNLTTMGKNAKITILKFAVIYFFT